ncbi:MAG: hypothetical protein ACD_71C00210G0001, partial [uncultured bacterium (gcode 4)]
MTERCHILRPYKPFFIHKFLSDDSHESTHSDSVTTHHDFLLLPFYIGIPESEIIGETGSELEDISHFRGFDDKIFLGSTFHTDESRWIDNLLVVSLITLRTNIHIILSDTEIRL